MTIKDSIDYLKKWEHLGWALNGGTVKQKGESYKLFIRKDTKGNSKTLLFHSRFYKFMS